MKPLVHFIGGIVSAFTLIAAIPVACAQTASQGSTTKPATKPDDATIRKLLPGQWTNAEKSTVGKGGTTDGSVKIELEANAEIQEEYKADGTFSQKMKAQLDPSVKPMVLSLGGTWSVKDGMLITKITRAADIPGIMPGKEYLAMLEGQKLNELKRPVFSITDKEYVTQSPTPGATDRITMRRGSGSPTK